MSYPTQPPAGQYPPLGAPGQYPPPGVPGQYPPPGVPGQYPPPGAPGQYPPPGAPGQYPLPGAPGQYPPSGAPGQYPPHGAPGQYPPLGAPGQYPPGAPGQYPPPGAPGQYPPPGASGQYPTPGAPGHYPAPAQSSGWDADDSDNEDHLRSKHDRHPVRVKFINRTNQKVDLYWISEKGKFKKMEKMKEGRIEVIDTYETHPFSAEAKKGRDAVINGNIVFFPQSLPGGHNEVKAEITVGPREPSSLRSSQAGHPVRVKFSNRTHVYATLKWIDPQGKQHKMKDIPPKKAWVTDSCEGHYFIACEQGREHQVLDMNYGWFHLVQRMGNPQQVRKVLITEPMDDSSSSSSSD